MDHSRPRRKAAVNKNYLDVAEEDEPKRKKGKKQRIPHNWQPPPREEDYFSHKLDLAGATVDMATLTLRLGALTIHKGDYIYMVSEPPGEPYYIGRVLGFSPRDDVKATLDAAAAHVFQVQWFYRPRDINKSSLELRLLFASMHSDTCPVTSYRGKVSVRHKLEFKEAQLEQYVATPNCFYFDKLFDRYMLKFYDIIKTSQLLEYIDNAANNSRHYILALIKRFEFVFMELIRTKQFLNTFATTESSHCDVCSEWCAPADSVVCGGCGFHFHMLCLDPPLLKKPSRGFSWLCAFCTKRQEIEYQNNRLVMLSNDNRLANEPDLVDFDLELPERKKALTLPKYEQMAIDFLQRDASDTVDARRLKEEWPMRYLGIHTKLEDALDMEDRLPYPRASTSLGPKFQVTNVPEYIDHPIVYYDLDSEPKKGKKKKVTDDVAEKLPIPEEYAHLHPRDFPHWLQLRPKGYVQRGDDSCLVWRPLEHDKKDNFATLDKYIADCAPQAEKLGLHPNSPNFVDAILRAYMENPETALDAVSKLTLKTLKEPEFSREEVKRFENGVKKYGSELYPTFREVKTQPCAMIVRFYYLWKKTDRGRQIWGNYPGRKKKAKSKQTKSTDLADSDDDSAYENDKIEKKGKTLVCKHCRTNELVQWFKGSNDEDDGVPALCFRCARLWRRYAVEWEEPLVVEHKKRGVGRKKLEYELIEDSELILQRTQNGAQEEREEKKEREKDKKEREKEKKDKDKEKEKDKGKDKEKGKDKDKSASPEKKAPVRVSRRREEKEKEKERKVEAKVEEKPKAEKPKPKPKPAKRKAEKVVVQVKRQKPGSAAASTVLNGNYRPDICVETVGDALQQRDMSELEPFVSDTKRSTCQVCLEALEEDVLTCLCGFGLHPLCGGIVVGRNRPRLWICDFCLNLDKVHFLTNDECALCLQGGARFPILESGRWCHLVCALFAFCDVSFRNLSAPAFVAKSVVALTNTKATIAVESTSRVAADRCHLCAKKGAVLACKACSKRVHVKCAQTHSFRVGFVVAPVKAAKANTTAFVEGESGKLQPAVCCPEHDCKIFDLRKLGSRSANGEQKTLVQMFIEDIARSTNPKMTGLQMRAHNYMHLNATKEERPFKAETCDNCKVTFSPKWWRNGGTWCHTCHQTKARTGEWPVYANEAEEMEVELHAPLELRHGLRSSLDFVGNVY